MQIWKYNEFVLFILSTGSKGCCTDKIFWMLKKPSKVGMNISCLWRSFSVFFGDHKESTKKTTCVLYVIIRELFLLRYEKSRVLFSCFFFLKRIYEFSDWIIWNSVYRSFWFSILMVVAFWWIVQSFVFYLAFSMDNIVQQVVHK